MTHGITHSLYQTRPQPLKFAMGGVWTERSVTERQRRPFFVNDAFPSLSYHVCATVKRLCLWMLLLSSMRRSRRGELRGERRGEMEEGDRRCPLGLSGCSRFSRRIFTRSSFRPECLGMGGTARVSWWVTPMPACWAMPAPGSTRTTTTTTSQMNGDSQRNCTSLYSLSESKNPLEF